MVRKMRRSDRQVCVEGRRWRQVKNTGWTDRKAVMIRAQIRRSSLSFCATTACLGPFSPYFFPLEKDQTWRETKYPTRNAIQPGIVLSQTQASKEPQLSSPNRYHRYLSLSLFFFSYFPFFVLSFPL